MTDDALLEKVSSDIIGEIREISGGWSDGQEKLTKEIGKILEENLVAVTETNWNIWKEQKSALKSIRSLLTLGIGVFLVAQFF